MRRSAAGGIHNAFLPLYGIASSPVRCRDEGVVTLSIRQSKVETNTEVCGAFAEPMQHFVDAATLQKGVP